jgi:hypothetical protein
MFIKHQKIMLPNVLLLNTVFMVLFVALFDYVLIEGHPYPFVTDEEKDDLFDELTDDEKDDLNDKDIVDDIPIYKKNDKEHMYDYDMY